MKKPLSLIALASTAAIALAACSAPAAGNSTTTSPAAETVPSTATDSSAPAEAPSKGTPVTITAGDVVMTATLNDTQVAQDFAAMLPVTLPWFRNAGIEYISELSAPLTETGPFYTDVQPGDIVYYNPLDSITTVDYPPCWV